MNKKPYKARWLCRFIENLIFYEHSKKKKGGGGGGD